MDDSFSGSNLDGDCSDSIPRCHAHDSVVKLSTDVSKLSMNDESNTVDTEDEEAEDEDELMDQMGYAKPKSTKDFDDQPKEGNNQNDSDGTEDEVEEEDELVAQMGYAKPESKRDTEEENNQTSSGSLQRFPPVSNLLSALKGSRSSKGGKCPALRVSWAPEVYDPIPTTPDQFASSSLDYEPKLFVGGKKRGGKGAVEIEEEGSYLRGNRINKGNDVRSAKGSRKERDKKQGRRQGRDKKYSSYSNYEDD